MPNVVHLFGIRKWLSLSGYVLLFLMLAFPMVLNLLYLKAFLFALLLISVVVRGASRTYLHLHMKVVTWTLALAVVSLFFCFRGMFLSAPGAVKCMQVYVVWPLVYLTLLDAVDRVDILRDLERTLIFSSLFIGLFGITYSLSQLGVIPEISYLDKIFSPDDLAQGLSSDGYARMTYPALNSVPFLVPFLVGSLAVRWSQPDPRWGRRLWLWIGLLLNLCVVLVSGRRALQLVAMLAPLLTLVVASFQPKKGRLVLRKSLWRVSAAGAITVLISVIVIAVIYPVSFSGMAERFSSGFEFSATSFDDSSGARREQFFALTRGWFQDPLIGAGLGASAYGSIRSDTMPWAYELYYLALLFQTGVLGFVAYAAGIVWIFRSAIKIIRGGGVYCQLMIPVLVGMSGFLIENGTNPNVARFDGLWMIFLPLAIINHWLLTRPHDSRCVGTTPHELCPDQAQ